VKDETKKAVAEAVDEAVDVAHKAVRNPWIRLLSQAGFYAKGVLYVVIGCLAVAAVIGVRGADLEDPRGALAIVAEKPYGRFLLLLFLVGAIGHGLWNILRAVTDVDEMGSGWFGIIGRSIHAIIGTFYIGLAASAIELILVSGVSEHHSSAEETFVSIVLALPLLGSGIIGIIGLGLVGAGFSECYNGLSGRFQANYRKWEITGAHGILITLLGILSFTVRAVLLVILGYFFLRASFNNAVDAAIGIDAALFALLDTTYGKILVTVAGVGLVGHGILAFYEARYRRLC
jgi:hypothetical protein